MEKNTPNWISYNYSDRDRKKKKMLIKFVLFFSAVVFLAGASYALFFISKFRSFEKKINPSFHSQPSLLETARSLVNTSDIDLKGMRDGRINILLLGMGGKDKPGKNLTDTIMITSIDTDTNQVALFSIPRDLYVKVPEEHFQGKINSVYQYGLNTFESETEAAELILKTAEHITSLDIDYYVILSFGGFEKIIDSLGGINIISDRDIFDSRYPGPNYSYETFQLSKGFHALDGATALKYVRERHDDPEGDFGRAKRQQQVLQAAKNKAFSVGTFLNVAVLDDLFNSLGETIETNITPEEIGSFIALSKKLDTQNINNFVLDAWNKDSLLKVSHVLYGNVNAFVLIPRVGNYSEISDVAQNIFDLNSIKARREAIASEEASVAILNRSGDPSLSGKMKKLLAESLEYKNISVVSNQNRDIQEKTFVHDFSEGTKPFTLDELIRKLPATLATDEDPFLKDQVGGRKSDLVISLGKDLSDIYNVKEGTLEDLNNERDNQDSAEFIKN